MLEFFSPRLAPAEGPRIPSPSSFNGVVRNFRHTSEALQQAYAAGDQASCAFSIAEFLTRACRVSLVFGIQRVLAQLVHGLYQQWLSRTCGTQGGQ